MMKRKTKKIFFPCFIIWIASYFISRVLWIALFLLGLLIGVSEMIFSMLNKLLKHTNWYKNNFINTNQFVSNAGYRTNRIRNYDIVNVGSNPALFSLSYENIKGLNWSTGTQGLDMDYQILRYFHSYIRKGGIVLLPITPFSSISPWADDKGIKKGNAQYIAKFASILDGYQVKGLPNYKSAVRFVRYPLMHHFKAVKYIIKDRKKDNRLDIDEQLLKHDDLILDAKKWMKGWKAEFDLNDLNDVFDARYKPYYDRAVAQVRKTIDFCIDRELQPVLMFPPMTDYLSREFPQKIKMKLMYDFIKDVNKSNIPFLDYTDNPEFKDPNLYLNSFFLNLHGRKLFTHQVLKDLHLID